MFYDPVNLNAHMSLRAWLGSFAFPAQVCCCARNLDDRTAFLRGEGLLSAPAVVPQDARRAEHPEAQMPRGDV